MRKICLCGVFSVGVLYCFVSLTNAAFEINKLAPEASALNDAYSALGKDPWSILYNPAQVTRLEGSQAALGYSRPYLGFGNFQANLVSGFFTRSAFQTGYGLGVVFVDTNLFYREIMALFNLGRRWGEKEDDWDIAFGTNLKILSLRRGDPTKPYDPALLPQTRNRMTADIGSHLRIQNFYLGVSAQNVVPANMGVAVKENVPVETRFGVGAKELWEIPRCGFKLSPAIEIAKRNEDIVSTGGVQFQLLDFVDFNLGLGTRNISFGFTLFLNPFMDKEEKSHSIRQEPLYRLSVAYQYPINAVDSVGSPLVGMTFLF